MEQKYNIKDESGDKKYFTQIPNMIANHSTAYEQSLYLIMKRLAGEHGSCFASLNWLSKKMGVDKKTVSKNITKILKRKWIKEIEKVRVKGGQVRQFIIIDLWKINIKEYESGRQIPSNRSGRIIPESGRIIPESGRQTDTKKNYIKNYTKKSSSFKKKPYYFNDEMRWSKKKWWVVPADGSEWLEYNGKEKDIVWE